MKALTIKEAVAPAKKEAAKNSESFTYSSRAVNRVKEG